MNKWYSDPKILFQDCPSAPEADALARRNKVPMRNNSGEVHCPCGTVIGCNLRGQAPILQPCRHCGGK